jgi:hypothetical protein
MTQTQPSNKDRKEAIEELEDIVSHLSRVAEIAAQEATRLQMFLNDPDGKPMPKPSEQAIFEPYGLGIKLDNYKYHARYVNLIS